MTRRIVHVVRPAAGGIRQHVLELLIRTDPARFSVALAAPTAFLHGLPAGLPLAGQAAIEITPSFSPGADLLAATRLAQFTRGRADLLHAHGLRAAWISALSCRLRPLPLLFTAHNLLPPSRLTRIGLRVIAAHAAQAIAVSQAVVDGLIANGFPPDRITVIPNGVDVEHFVSITRNRETNFTVGCVARLSPEKGVDVLLRAAALLPDVAFIIAGDGPERAALERLAPVNAQLLGWIADTRTLYAAADVLAVPSRQEGQGLVALEAMACGVSVVASRVGGLEEMLTDNETALMVPPDAHDALAAAVRRLRDNLPLCQRLAAQALALVQERYDVRQMIASVEQVYADISADR